MYIKVDGEKKKKNTKKTNHRHPDINVYCMMKTYMICEKVEYLLQECRNNKV
jgi:hypothetical protein